MTPSSQDIPLVVDLDGTLLRSDLLLESVLLHLRSHPLGWLKWPIWFVGGKAYLKDKLADTVNVDVSVLPYDEEVLAFIQQARAQGRRVILATASHVSLAEQVAEHLACFDQVLATKGGRNLSSLNKRQALVESFGERGFDYMGNSSADLAVWASAHKAIVVNPEAGVAARARKQGNVQQVMRTVKATGRDWAKALRLHQWLKNALVFVPLLASHQLTNVALLWHAVLAFVLFGICASSVYLLNDLLDLQDDRHHRSKRFRPFAAGRLPLRAGILLSPLLLGVAFLCAAIWLPWEYLLTLATYYVLTLSYSFFLKRHMAVDVIALALLYTVRIVAGATACDLPLTFWILAFSMFIFLSLALVKRYAELAEAKKQGKTEKTRGRGYYPGDLDMVASLGSASGYLAVMVLALYIRDSATTALYTHPQLIWLACPLLLFWVTRVWMLTHRGLMNDDPVVFAIRDRVSLVIGALFAVVFWVAA